MGRNAAELDRLHPRVRRCITRSGQTTCRNDSTSVLTRRNVQREDRLLGIQHCGDSSAHRSHSNHGLRLPLQRHWSDRTDWLGAFVGAVRRCRGGWAEDSNRGADLWASVD